MSREAMKLALEALKQIDEAMPFPVAKLAQAALREALAQQPARPYRLLQDNGSKYFGESWDKAEQPAQQALDKMAENARELGIQMQPAQQEPVAWMHEWEDGERIPLLTGRDDRNIDEPKSVRPLVYADTFPPAQRTWVGLTDEEIKQAMDYWSSDEHSAYGGAASAAGEYFDVETSWRYIEAKLKEKNNG